MQPLSKSAVFAAIVETGGNLSQMAKNFGTTRRNMADYIAGKRSLRIAMTDAQEEMIDDAEAQLRTAVKGGDQWAVRLALLTGGKNRGYTTRPDVENERKRVLREQRDCYRDFSRLNDQELNELTRLNDKCIVWESEDPDPIPEPTPPSAAPVPPTSSDTPPMPKAPAAESVERPPQPAVRTPKPAAPHYGIELPPALEKLTAEHEAQMAALEAQAAGAGQRSMSGSRDVRQPSAEPDPGRLRPARQAHSPAPGRAGGSELPQQPANYWEE